MLPDLGVAILGAAYPILAAFVVVESRLRKTSGADRGAEFEC